MNERSRSYNRARQIRKRRKRQLVRRMSLFLVCILAFLTILMVKKRGVLAILPSGVIGIGDEASREKTVHAIATEPVKAPIVYTREEAIQQIQAMAESDERYGQVMDNINLYPDSLVKDLANNSEMLDYVLSYSQDGNVEAGSLSKTELSASCPLLLQWDKRWGNQLYGEDNIAIGGCGPTALSMVIVGLTHNQDATPAQVATFAEDNHYYIEGSGTRWALITEGAADYGLKSEEIANDETAMKDALDQNAFLICSMGAGDFTTAGHFIVICGYGEDGFEVNDPFCAYRSAQKWSYEELQPQIVGMWALSQVG